jgi:hypothetical protein
MEGVKLSNDPDAIAIRQSTELVETIRAILRGKPPDVQGAVLLELLAMFIAGHAPSLREEMLALHIETVRELVPVVEQELGDPWGTASARQ